MQGIAELHQRSLPNTLINLPIIVMFAFPPIGEDGWPMPRLKAIEINNKLLDDVVRIGTEQVHQPRGVETLHLILKFRWIGMEEEARQHQMQVQESAPTGGIIAVPHETD